MSKKDEKNSSGSFVGGAILGGLIVGGIALLAKVFSDSQEKEKVPVPQDNYQYRPVQQRPQPRNQEEGLTVVDS